MHNVRIEEKAFKFLETLPLSDLKLFYSKLEIVRKDPYGPIPFAKRLKNSTYYRFRFGKYRCVYNIIDEIITIEIIKIDDRKNVYRR